MSRVGARRRGRHTEDGIANIWSVLILAVLVGFTALAVDVGFLVWVGQQLQIGADGAALAAVRHVRIDDTLARLAAVNIAYANMAAGNRIFLSPNADNEATGDIVVGRFRRDTPVPNFDPDAKFPNAVRVVARRTDTSLGGPVPLHFARILGSAKANVARVAIAMIGGGTEAGLIVLDSKERHAFYAYGNVTLSVDGGAIQVNSTDEEAALFQGDIVIDGSEVNMCGDYATRGHPVLPELNPGSDSVPDPLAYLPDPVWNPADDLGAVNILGGEDVVLTPGYYSGGIAINNGSLTLAPGIYVLDGVGLNITGGDFYAEGVMFFIAGTGRVKILGNGEVHIVPPDPEVHGFPEATTYEDIAIFQARDNYCAGTIVGTALMDLEGTYYFPSNHIGLGGDATKFGNQFIVNTLEVFGNGNLTINYDGRNPAPGSDVFLVY